MTSTSHLTAIHKILSYSFCMIYVSACTLSGYPEVTPPSIIEVNPDAKQQATQNTIGYKQAKMLKVPGSVLMIKAVNKPSTPLRLGPGTHFPISDRLLQWGQTVIETESFKVWRKIIIPDNLRTGWVHHKTLTTQVSGARKNQIYHLPSNVLPIKHSKKSSAELYTFHDLVKLDLEIPENTPFIQLQTQNQKSLILLNKNGNVAWISSKLLY